MNTTDSSMSTNSQSSTDPLAQWCMDRVKAWEDYRDENFKEKWDEYYRLWRGIWTEKDKNRQSERSRLISPALQQAIETTVAEIEEATFGRKKWVDIEKDVNDKDGDNEGSLISILLEEYDLNKVTSAVSEVFLNGALYGTGIAKIVVDTRKVITPSKGEGGVPVSTESEEPIIRVEPIDPRNFAIDPVARTIEEAIGCSHTMYVPKWSIAKKQRDGFYKDVPIGAGTDDSISSDGETEPTDAVNYTKIVEYHGLVPKSLLPKDELGSVESTVDSVEDTTALSRQSSNNVIGDFDYDNEELIEAIVTIANDTYLLRAVENPNFMKDRNIIAYQHESVPNRFYGRGVAERGYNPQKALDAELRARMDSLAYSLNPMMAINAMSMPRQVNDNISVYPGKTFLVNGPVGDSVAPIGFNPPPPQSFQHSADLERMIEMGTGAMQASSPLSHNPRNSTASGISMIQSGFIKRSRRTLQNIERSFLVPMVRKSLWRYMQVDPERFPLLDVKFNVYSTLGIVAREFEQHQLTNLLQTVPPNSPAFWILLKSLFQNSNIYSREEVLPIIDQMMQQALQPPKPTAEENIKMGELQLKQSNQKMDELVKKTSALLNLAKAGSLGNQTVIDELQLIQEMMANEFERTGGVGNPQASGGANVGAIQPAGMEVA